MEESNVTLTKYLQAEKNPASVMIFHIISALVPYAGGAIMFVLAIALHQKIQCIKFITHVVLGTYLNALLKMLYVQPRPYMVYPDILGLDCNQDFGRPSGHSMVGFILYSTLYFLFVYPMPSKTRKQRLFKGMMLFWAMAIVFMVGLSRVYLGAHSYGQVLLGWTFGALYMLAVVSFFDDFLERSIIHLAMTTGKWKAFRNLTIVYGIILTITCALYVWKQHSVDYTKLYDVIVAKCNVEPKIGKSFFEGHVLECAMVSAGYGFLCGLLLIKKTNSDFKLGWRKELLRFFIFIIVAGLPALAIELIPKSKTLIWFNFFVRSVPQILIPTLLLVWLAPIVCNRCLCSRGNDFLAIELEAYSKKVKKIVEDLEAKI
jgi:membrane-associated phospholipid phosphatase